MKVILLEDIKKLGKKFEIAEVKAGYARNFLLVKGLAEAVTKSNARRVVELQKKRDEEVKRQAELLEKAFKGIKGLVLTFTRKANEEGHLYAGVTREEIAVELSKAMNAEFTPDHIILEKPIKQLGTIPVAALLNDKTAQFDVTVVLESEEAAA